MRKQAMKKIISFLLPLTLFTTVVYAYEKSLAIELSITPDLPPEQKVLINYKLYEDDNPVAFKNMLLSNQEREVVEPQDPSSFAERIKLSDIQLPGQDKLAIHGLEDCLAGINYNEDSYSIVLALTITTIEEDIKASCERYVTQYIPLP